MTEAKKTGLIYEAVKSIGVCKRCNRMINELDEEGNESQVCYACREELAYGNLKYRHKKEKR